MFYVEKCYTFDTQSHAKIVLAKLLDDEKLLFCFKFKEEVLS